jgi:hypothetical protein
MVRRNFRRFRSRDATYGQRFSNYSLAIVVLSSE